VEWNISEDLSNIIKVQIRRQRLPGSSIPSLAMFQRFFTKSCGAADTSREDPTLYPSNAPLTEIKQRIRVRHTKDSSKNSPDYTRKPSLVPQIRNRKRKSTTCKYSQFHNLKCALALLQKFTTSFCRLGSLKSCVGYNPNRQVSRSQHKLERQRLKNMKKKTAFSIITQEKGKKHQERKRTNKESDRGKPKKQIKHQMQHMHTPHNSH